MTELLVLTERVRNTIQLGESHFREFKSAFEGKPGNKHPRRWAEICRDIAEALVSFANADGGDLIVGVEDDGTITGVPHDMEDRARLLDACNSHVHAGTPLPVLIATSLELDNHTLLFFSVSKGTTGVFQLPDGRCVRRSGKNTVPELVEKILFDQRETRSRQYDSEFLDGAQTADLDLLLLQSTADQYLRGITPEKYLQQVGLAEYASGGLRLRRAATFLFAKSIQRWHPRCQIRILKIAGTELRSGPEYNVTSDELVEGNLFELLVRSWERLRPFLASRTEFGTDTRFEQKYIYPEWACREALVNAIAHRNYSIQNSVDVFVYDDRIEIKSPGALLSTLSIDQLLKLEGAHESRNALISKVLRESGYMRELGEGMRRIFSLMEESDLERPELGTDEGSFTVRLFHRSVFSSQQMAWLSLFDEYHLSKLQQRIVVAGMHDRELSPRDIYRAMNTDDRDAYDGEVTGLRKAGILLEIRSNSQAGQVATATRRPKADIPRFKVSDPRFIEENANQIKVDRARSVAVFGLPFSATAEEITEVFSIYGAVERVTTPKGQQSGLKVKYVFVQFADELAAQSAVRASGLVLLGGEKLSVRPSR